MDAKGYLSFTRKERLGIFALLIVMFAAALIPRYFYPEKIVRADITPAEFERLTYKPPKLSHYRASKQGLPAMPSEGETNLTKYTATGNFHRPRYQRETRPFDKWEPRPRPKPSVIDVNASDTTAFIRLPGIGSKLAARIVSFREKLGGFYDARQISEVYGLSDSVFRIILPYLRCDTAYVRRIELNNAARDELRSHPYIRWQMAEALLSYRNHHGAFKSWHEISNIEKIDSMAVRKLIPYLSFK